MFISEVTNCFFTVDATDIQNLTQKFLSNQMFTQEYLNNASRSWWRKKGARGYIKDADKIKVLPPVGG
jgi:molybdopterin converting factor small subunit